MFSLESDTVGQTSVEKNKIQFFPYSRANDVCVHREGRVPNEPPSLAPVRRHGACLTI